MTKKNSDETESKRFEVVPISILHHDPANLRTHSTRNLEAIKASLARFGQQDPLIVGKGNIVLAGNARLDAMRDMGLEEVSILRTDLEGADAVAFAIAHNRTAELASWDTEELAAILEGLSSDFDIDAELGFSEGELDYLLGRQDGWDDYELPEPNPDGEASASESIRITFDDVSLRRPIMVAIEQLAEENGWGVKIQ